MKRYIVAVDFGREGLETQIVRTDNHGAAFLDQELRGCHAETWRIGHVGGRILIELHTPSANQHDITFTEFDTLLVQCFDQIITGHSVTVAQHIDTFRRRDVD